MLDVDRPDAAVPEIRPNPLIRRLERLAPLSGEDKTALTRLGWGVRNIDAGVDLLREGDGHGGLCVVMEGFACRYRLRADGARQITDFILPGDFCDFGAQSGSALHAVSTLTCSKVVRVSAETLHELTETHPAIQSALHMAAMVVTATLREWLMNIGRRSAEARIAHLFCELFTRMQTVGLVHENSFRLPLTQFDLGDTMGLSYVHVNRTLQSLRQQGLFVLRSKTLTIVDLEGLQKIAGFSSNYLG